METEKTNLEAALRDKDFPKAEKLMREAAEQKMTESEKAEALTGAATAYMDIVNSTNEQYRESLLEILEGMKRLGLAEKKSDDQIKIAEVRESLNNP